jgi:hypothetical protein
MFPVTNPPPDDLLAQAATTSLWVGGHGLGRFLWRAMALGVGIFLMACQPALPEEQGLATLPPVTPFLPTPAPVVVPSPSPPSSPPTPTSLPTVTAPATNRLPANWQEVGQPDWGVSLATPADWVDIGRLENIVSLTNRLQQPQIIFMANEVRTGVQVLTGRELAEGAFVVGFQTAAPLPASLNLGTLTDPVAGLESILTRAQMNPADTRPVSLSNAGAYVDVGADPTGMLFNAQQKIRLRVALFIQPETGVSSFLFMGAAQSQWAEYSPLFDYMLETVVLYDAATGTAEGMRFLDTSPANNYRTAVTSQIAKDKFSIWIFAAREGQYATIVVAPQDNSRDLTLTLLTPSGRTIAQQDNGFAGDVETLVDIPLPETGSYMIQVGEFFNEAADYTLELALSDEPLYRDGGRLEINQSLEATLRPGGEDLWVFNGQAGQIISIILSPGAPFDAVFTLYAPDGSKIATLDEGYSGDAEILAFYPLPATGDYTIAVKSFGDNGGRYTLAVDEGNEDVSTYYEAGDLPYGNTQQESLREGEIHAWYIAGLAGDEITLEARPLDGYLDLDLWLLDPDARRLVMRDDTLAGQPERISYVLPRDGIYIVVVQDFFGEAGDYELTLTVSGKNYLVEAGELAYGQTSSDSLIPGRGAIWYFTGEEGDIIRIAADPLESPTTDLVLSLRDPANQPIIQIDEALADGEEVLATFTLTTSGRWAIIIQDYLDSGGRYSLTLVRE